jgi:hypothetical protein
MPSLLSFTADVKLAIGDNVVSRKKTARPVDVRAMIQTNEKQK